MRILARRGTRLLACAATGLLALTLIPVAAADPSFSPSASIRSSACDRGLSWRGSIMPTRAPGDISYAQTRGRHDFCSFVYRISDEDRRYDYFAVAAGIRWKRTSATDDWEDNPASVVIGSTVKGTLYDASDTVSGKSCSSGVSVGLSVGFVSASVTPVLCKSHSLDLNWMNFSAARWSSTDVAGTPKWETMYLQRVRQGAKPTYRVTLRWPQFVAYYDYGRNIMRYRKEWGQRTQTHAP